MFGYSNMWKFVQQHNLSYVMLYFESEPDLFSASPVSLYPQLAYLLSQIQYFVCPVGFNSETNGFTIECEPSDIFVMHEYTLPAVLQKTLRWVRLTLHTSVYLFLLQIHKQY